MSTNFHTNVGSVDIAAFLQFQTVSDLFQTCFSPLWDIHTFPYKRRISGYSCFPTISDGFRPVSDLFGRSTNFHINVGSADIAAFLQFQTVSNLFQTSLGGPQISSGYNCFPTISDGFRPVSDLFGMSTNFHTNVGLADLAAFL